MLHRAREHLASPEHGPGGTRRFRSRRLYIVDLAILVAGILVAFSLESWWNERGRNHEARASLIALRQDFRQNQIRLDSVATMLRIVEHAGAELLRIANTEQPMPSPDSMRSLVARAFRLAGFQPVTSAYDNLINAHALDLVRDRELRLVLAMFVSQVKWLTEVQRWQNDQWVFVTQPFFNEAIEVGDLADYWVDAGTRAGLPPARHTTDWRSVLENRTFRNIVMQRIVAADDIVRTQAALRGQIDNVMQLLDRALEE